MDPQATYDRILKEAERAVAPAYFVEMSRLFAQPAIWKSYDELVAAAPHALAGRTAVDIGCKYGHALPVFLCRGAAKAIGVDVVDEYLDAGRRILGGMFPSLDFAKSEDGLLPLPPSSADLVLLNEVISHVNPMFLENLYADIARILKPGGHVIISDGNNIANADCRKALTELYDAWENGPTGRRTDRDVVTTSFLDRRRKIIRDRHPALEESKVDYLARNTSGLFGALLDHAVDDFVRTGVLTERPYRRGTCPTSPGPGGEVMERGFYPQQVEMALGAYGIRARQILEPPKFTITGLRGTVRSAAAVLGDRLRRWRDPDAGRGDSWGFCIVGVKEF